MTFPLYRINDYPTICTMNMEILHKDIQPSKWWMHGRWFCNEIGVDDDACQSYVGYAGGNSLPKCLKRGLQMVLLLSPNMI